MCTWKELRAQLIVDAPGLRTATFWPAIVDHPVQTTNHLDIDEQGDAEAREERQGAEPVKRYGPTVDMMRAVVH